MGGPDATMFHGHIHELIDAGKKNIVVDLNKVGWMSSIGMGMLIAGLTTVKNNDGQFKVACIPGNISTLLTLTQLITIFDTYDTIEEALQSFS
jgi:anti-sigma B factor antagonist